MNTLGRIKRFLTQIIKGEYDATPVEEPKPAQQYADTLVRNGAGEIMLMQRASHDDFAPLKWSLPGGKIENGELPMVAGIRELEEETGMTCVDYNDYRYLTTITKPNAVIHYYEATLEKDNPMILLDNEEHFRYEFVPFQNIDRYDTLLDLGNTLKELEPMLNEPIIKAEVEESVELVFISEEPNSLIKSEDINNAFNEGLIDDADFIAYTKINQALNTITKGYDSGEVSEGDFFSALKRANDYEFIKGEEDYFLFDADSLNRLNKAEELGLLDTNTYDIEKGRKAMPIGTRAVWGGIQYLKTASGWKPVGKVRGHVKENHDFIHKNEQAEKDHHAMMLDAGKMESKDWTEKHGSTLHEKYKQVYDYLHKERVKREKKAAEETKSSEPEATPVTEPPVTETPVSQPASEEPSSNSLGLVVSAYSDKSIIITGETYKNLDLIRDLKKELGVGIWAKGAGGWIFPASAKDKIMAAIASKIPVDTYNGEMQKEAAIELKNAVDTGTPVSLDGEETIVTEVTTNEDGKVEYTTENKIEGVGETTVTETEIAIPPATEEKAEELINNANEENRLKTGKMLFGKEEGEKPVSAEIDENGTKDIKAELKDVTARNGKVIKALDYSFVTPKDVQMFNQDDILDKPKPYWVPEIDESSFAGKGYVLNYIKHGEDQLLIELNKGRNFMSDYYSSYGTATKTLEANYAVVSMEQYVAIQDYYCKKKKAELERDNTNYLKKRADTIRGWRQEQIDRYKPFEYDALTKEQKKKYSPEKWQQASLDDKIAEVPFMKKPVFKGLSTRITTLKDNLYPLSYFSMYKDLVDANDLGLKYKGKENRSKSIIEFDELRKTLGFKAIDLETQKEENDNSFVKGRETSYGNSGTKDDLLESHGVKVKLQNGKEIEASHIAEIKKHLSDVYSVFGNRSSLAKNFGLKISHSGDVLMHARKAVGLYVPSMRAIGVSAKYGSEEFGFTLAHEFGHFLDNALGRKQERHYASDNYNSTAGKIASVYRKNMNEKTDSNYINRSCECLARSFEAYHAYKTMGEKSPYFSQPYHVNKEKFETLVKPLIEQFLSENDHLLKSAYNELNLIDINNSFELIKAAFDKDEIELPQFLDACKKYDKITKSDATHGGKLVKKTIIDKMGKKETKWVKQGDDKENENKAPTEPVKHSHKVLSAFAAETPEKELKRVINESSDEKLRRAAHAELDRRGKKEKPQDDKKSASKKPAEKKESKEEGKKEVKEQWYDKYKQHNLNKYPVGIDENSVQVNTSGDVNSHWVLSWKDKAGKVQYGYTNEFMQRNADKKWKRTASLNENKIDKIKTSAAKGLTSNDVKVKQAAAVIGIIANTGLRVGSRAAFSITENRGVTTLHPDNVQIKGDEISFNFKGKSHKQNVSSFKDKQIADCLSELKEKATKEKSDFLFSDIDRPDVDRIFKNNFGGTGMKIKDMRTYMAASTAKDYLYNQNKDFKLTGDNKIDEKAIAGKFNELYQFVSKVLNNTPVMAKQSYINPEIRKQWLKDIGFTGDNEKVMKAENSLQIS